jgi:hypothetical protein
MILQRRTKEMENENQNMPESVNENATSDIKEDTTKTVTTDIGEAPAENVIPDIDIGETAAENVIPDIDIGETAAENPIPDIDIGENVTKQEKQTLPKVLSPGVKKCRNCGSVLESDEMFCSKCGQKYIPAGISTQGISAYNSKLDAEKNKKENRKRILLHRVLPASLIAVFAGLCVWCLYMSGWSFPQAGKIISTGNFQCFISHDYKAPNCLHGYLCKNCGFEIGEKTDHTWQEATCEEPETCSVCKKQQGEALGHGQRIGYCARCKEYVTELLPNYNRIVKNFNEAVAYMTTAAENAGYARTSYYFRESYTYEAQVALQNAKKSLKKISKACGSYWEFSSIKSDIDAAYSDLSYWSVYSCSYYQVLSELSDACDDIENTTDKIKKYEE